MVEWEFHGIQWNVAGCQLAHHITTRRREKNTVESLAVIHLKVVQSHIYLHLEKR